MAKKNNEAKIKFTAETGDFNADIKKSNDTMSQLSAELKLNETQMKATGKTVEGMEKKHEILAEQLKASENKTEALNKKLQKAVEIYGENSDEANKLKKQLTNAQIAEEKVRQAVDACSDEMKEQKKASIDLSGSLSKIGEVGKIAVAGIAAIGTAAAAGATALAGMSKSGAEYADNVLTESTVTGIATDKLQEYQYAAELVDVSVDTMTKSMAKNIKSMKSAQDGSKTYVEAYEKLGVAAVDANGNLRDSETVYWELIDSLGKIENETERDALAMTVLGKSAQELNPLIEAGADTMKDLGQQAHEAGYVLDEHTLDAFGTFDDQLQYLNVGAEAAKNALGGVLLPVLTDLSASGVDLLGNFTNAVNDANGDMGAIGSAVGTLVTDGVGVISEMLPQVIDMGVTLITSIVGSVIEAIPTLVDGVIACLPALIDGIVTLFNSLVTALPSLIQTLLSALPTLIPLIIDAVVLMIVTLCTMLPEIIQPIIDNLPTIIISIVEALTNNLPILIEGLITLIIGLVQALPQIIQSLVDAIPMVVSLLVEALLQNLPALIVGFVQLVAGLVVAVPQIFMSLIDAVINVIIGLWNGIKNVFAPAVEYFSNLWNAVKEKVASIITSMREKVTGIFDNIKSKITNVANAIRSVVSNVFGKVRDAMEKPIQKARDTIKGIIDKIKGFFSGMKLSFPKISLPKFSIKPKGWKIGDLLKGSIPKLGISWHADGAIFTRPTLIGSGNRVHGVGEAGAEAVLPIDKLEGYVAGAIEKTMQVVDLNVLASKIEDLANRPINLWIGDRQIAIATASASDNVNGLRSTFKNRGLALD